MTRARASTRERTAFHLSRLAPGLLLAVFAIIVWDLLSVVVAPGDALAGVVVLTAILAGFLLVRRLLFQRRPHSGS